MTETDGDGPAPRRARGPARDVVPILMYHSVGDRAPGSTRAWTHSPAVLRSHLGVVTGEGYEPLTVSEYLAARRGARPLPERAVVVTFDDGYRDFATEALGLLATARVPVTLYVTSAYIGGHAGWRRPDARLPMLSARELAGLPADLVEVGAHGHTHVKLDTVPVEAARDEIRRSKATLEDTMGREVLTFAYPHGRHDAAVRRLVREEGFAGACAVGHALSWSGDDDYALARVIVAPDLRPRDLSAVLRGVALARAGERARLRTRAWRLRSRVRARLRTRR